MKPCTRLLLAAVVSMMPCAWTQSADGFTYQGRLTDNGSPANGSYRVSFTVFATPTFGNPVSSPVTNQVSVANGLFTTSLDYGVGGFDGSPRWLEIAVLLTNGSSPVVLSPRHQITPAPYALFAATAGSVTNGAIAYAQLASNAVATANLQDDAVTGAKIANGQVVKSFNGLHDDVALVVGLGLGLTTNGNALRIEAQPFPDTVWSRTGNAGTTSGGDFLGTTDNQPLELKVNNSRALRIVPGTDQPNIIGGPNIVAGASVNFVASDLQGATIAGGGLISSFGNAYPNRILSNSLYATIGGGLGNTISTNAGESTIGGGNQNAIHPMAFRSVIGGGVYNSVGPGCYESTISGGGHNQILDGAFGSALGGGTDNVILSNATSATIAGGWHNAIHLDSWSTTVGGGQWNQILTNSNSATIAGGQNNIVQNNSSITTIGGGYYNTIEADCAGATISGGDNHFIRARSPGSFIGGGTHNEVLSDAWNGTVSGGFSNVVAGDNATVGGGAYNRGGGATATIAGGELNTASGSYSTVGGGHQNFAGYHAATVCGGDNNYGGGAYSVVAGGFANSADGDFATVPGGFQNIAAAASSFAAGQHAQAVHPGSFVWSSYITTAAKSFADSRFHVFGYNGFSVDYGAQIVGGGGERWIYIGPQIAGQTIATWTGAFLSDGGMWQNASDYHRKTDFEACDPSAILKKVAALPIRSWRYTNEGSDVRHLGPTAQDFKAAFELGTDDKSIGTVDADGVALAAIQGLHQIVQAQQAELAAREAEHATLKEKVAALQKELAAHQQTLTRWESRFTALDQALDRAAETRAAAPSAVFSTKTK